MKSNHLCQTLIFRYPPAFQGDIRLLILENKGASFPVALFHPQTISAERRGELGPGIHGLGEGLQDRVGRRRCGGKVQLLAPPLQERIQNELRLNTG